MNLSQIARKRVIAIAFLLSALETLYLVDWIFRPATFSHSQRRTLGAHPKIMKARKIFLPLSVVLIAVLLLSTWAEIGRLAGKLILYMKVAELYLEPPDTDLLMPIKEVKTSQIANTWHAPRAGGRLHEGQDIFAAKDTPIYSATVGYILRIGENDLGGHTVSVVGTGGRVYYYAHLDSYAVRIVEGDYVDTETVLGYVGTTGNAKGGPPHLHFGVYTRQGAIDPLPLLEDRAK